MIYGRRQGFWVGQPKIDRGEADSAGDSVARNNVHQEHVFDKCLRSPGPVSERRNLLPAGVRTVLSGLFRRNRRTAVNTEPELPRGGSAFSNRIPAPLFPVHALTTLAVEKVHGSRPSIELGLVLPFFAGRATLSSRRVSRRCVGVSGIHQRVTGLPPPIIVLVAPPSTMRPVFAVRDRAGVRNQRVHGQNQLDQQDNHSIWLISTAAVA